MIIPGRTWALSRRTTRRHFLFTPDRERRVEGAFWYCLAYTANKFRVEVHAAVLMSTHIHLIVTDTEGRLPHFLQEFHRLFALCVKAMRGWAEEVLNKAPTGQHELRTSESTLEAIAYLIANPAAAGAVRFAHDWPGAITLPQHLGSRIIVARRPGVYFNSANPVWPERLALSITCPASVQTDFGAGLARRRVRDRVRELERDALTESRNKGVPFRGVRKVLRDSHVRRALSREDFGEINPRFAAGSDREAALAAIDEFRRFEADYSFALARWSDGDRDVRFPYGTWWMRIHHAVGCAPPS